MRIGLASALLAASAAAHAQAYTPPPPNLTTGPCIPTRTEPCDTQPAKAPSIPATADKFPFPGETSSAPGQNPDAPAAPGAQPPSAPAAAPQTPAGKQFPFPGEAPDSSSSSSSSSPADPSDGPPADSAPDPATDTKTKLKDEGSTGSTRFARRKIVAPEDVNHRELEDLEVSKYYMSTGSYVAAYSRAQDALRLYPDDENAHIAVAVAAEKLNKKPEAIAEYHAYLAAAPDGEKSKVARHALELLEPGTSASK